MLVERDWVSFPVGSGSEPWRRLAVAMPVDATDAYAQALRALWEAAGSPTGKAIERKARSRTPSVRVSDATWSDWKNGRTVPSNPAVARWLIEEYLRPLARTKTPDYVAPPARWWEQMRERSVAERPKGGRPPTSHRSAAPIEKPPLVQVGLVPPEADSFQSREVASWLEQATVEDGTVVLCQVLAGMGGVGKTQLAAAYARRARSRVELVVWAVAASASAVIDVYADAAVRLGLCDRDDPERAARAFLAWAAMSDRPWLVVLDDVQEQQALRGWWPPANEVGTTIVTTRLRGLAPPGLRPQNIEVDVYTTDEARSYLEDRTPNTDPDERDELIKDLGQLPLALTQATAYMTQQDMGCARYRELLRDRLLVQVVPEERDLTDEHQHIISATWDLSISQADQARPAGIARPLLNLISFLDPNGIPAVVLTSQPALNYLATHLADPGDEANSGIVDQALRVLHRYNLITHDRTSTHQEIRVHQLVQRAIREALPIRQHNGLAHAAADALDAVWPPVDRNPLGQALRANTVTLVNTTGSVLNPRNGIPHQIVRRSWLAQEAPEIFRRFSQYAGITIRRKGSFKEDRGGQGCGSVEVWNGMGYYNDLFTCGVTYPSGSTFYCSPDCYYSP